MSSNWFANCFRQGFANVGGKDLTHFNATEPVRRFKEMGRGIGDPGRDSPE